jgi:hypothetical protein
MQVIDVDPSVCVQDVDDIPGGDPDNDATDKGMNDGTDQCTTDNYKAYLGRLPPFLECKSKLFKKRNRPHVLNLCPYVPLDPTDCLGAWSALVLHHKHYTSLAQLGSFQDAVETLRHAIVTDKMCDTFTSNMNKSRVASKDPQTAGFEKIVEGDPRKFVIHL